MKNTKIHTAQETRKRREGTLWDGKLFPLNESEVFFKFETWQNAKTLNQGNHDSKLIKVIWNKSLKCYSWVKNLPGISSLTVYISILFQICDNRVAEHSQKWKELQFQKRTLSISLSKTTKIAEVLAKFNTDTHHICIQIKVIKISKKSQKLIKKMMHQCLYNSKAQ